MKEIKDVNDLEVPSVDDIKEVKKGAEVPVDSAPVEFEKKDEKRPEVPDSEVNTAKPDLDPKFKVLRASDGVLDETVSNSSKSYSKIKKMELPSYNETLPENLASIDIRDNMPKIPEGATDTVSWVQGINTREALKVKQAPTTESITPRSLMGGATVTSVMTDGDSTEKPAMKGLVHQEDQKVTSSTIVRPSDALNTLMDTALASASSLNDEIGTLVVDNSTATIGDNLKISPSLQEPQKVSLGEFIIKKDEE